MNLNPDPNLNMLAPLDREDLLYLLEFDFGRSPFTRRPGNEFATLTFLSPILGGTMIACIGLGHTCTHHDEIAWDEALNLRRYRRRFRSKRNVFLRYGSYKIRGIISVSLKGLC